LEEIKKILERKVKNYEESLLKEINADPCSSCYKFLTEEVPNIKREVIEKCKKALEKIKGRTFGICENCREKISLDRLKAVPSFEFCKPKCS